ncbi:restriction endonuclease subunit S [Candidatus Competibacter denitrificans]|uniref:restriction endonuclease subunit S n=1 Tax=Candidatus Competibacter denitrificans TaxID=1400862 RepID=UPI0011120E9A
MKHVGTVMSGTGFPHEYQGTENEEFPFLKVSDMSAPGSEKWISHAVNSVSMATAKELGASIVPEHSIVYAKIGAALLLNKRRLVGRPSCIDNNMSAFVPSSVTPEWALWWMSTLDFGEYVNPGTIPSFTEGQQKDLPFLVPPLEIQRLIANYLDRETARIDGLIAEKERMLALLEEKRAALISRAVTRGLDPNAPLKLSGQEWLGETPAHWEEPRAKGLFHEIDRRTETGEETLLSLRMGKGLVPHNDVSEKLLEANDVTGFKKIEPGQMVINRMRAASGLIAVATEPGLVSPDYAVFDVVDQELSIEYFLELFKTSLLQAVFRSSSKGLGTGEQGFLRLYTDAFLSLHFPYPPIGEQRAIASFIKQQCSEMLHMESLLRRSIDLAKERRAALITAAVTGQIPLEAMRE